MLDSERVKIGVVGRGYVGKAVIKFFEQKYRYWVHWYDKYQMDEYEDRHGSNTAEVHQSFKDGVNQCQVAFVCVPTPFAEDGSCETSIVEEVLSWLTVPLIVIKSTVPPGTVDKLKEKYGKRIVFSPEFCGEPDYDPGHNFAHVVANEPFYIFGGDKEDTSACVDLFSRLAGPTKKYFQCTAKEAETIKYFENTALGVKVVMAYEFHQICKALGVDWNTVREGWLLDPRIGSSHTAVFEDNHTPFGGKCLPKDITALTKFSEKAGYKAKFIEEVLDSNTRIGLARRFGAK